MKKFFTIIVVILSLTGTAMAQVRVDTVKSISAPVRFNSNYKETKMYHYSLGVKVYGYEQFPKILRDVNSSDFKSTPLSGVFFKVNDNQISYRFSGNFYNKDISFNNECADCEKVEGKFTDYSIKFGFEKALSYSTLQPYFGFDLGFRKNRFKGTGANAGTVNYTTTPYEILAEKNGGQFSPLLGFKINLNHFTLGGEGSLDILFNYERQEKTMQDATRTRTFNKYNNWEYLAKPLGQVFIQYNFG